MKSRLLFLLALLAFLLAGISYASPTPLPTPKQVIGSLANNFKGLRDYTCTAEAHYRKGRETEDKVYLIYFKRPNLVRAEVISGDNEGGVAVLNKEGKVQAHSGGFLSWLILNLDTDNPLVTTIRGNRMDESSFVYMVEKMKEGLPLKGEGEVHTAGYKVINGVKTVALESNYTQRIDGITKEIAYVVPGKWMIKKILEYEGSVEVINVTYSDVKVNSGLSDKLFTM